MSGAPSSEYQHHRENMRGHEAGVQFSHNFENSNTSIKITTWPGAFLRKTSEGTQSTPSIHYFPPRNSTLQQKDRPGTYYSIFFTQDNIPNFFKHQEL